MRKKPGLGIPDHFVFNLMADSWPAFLSVTDFAVPASDQCPWKTLESRGPGCEASGTSEPHNWDRSPPWSSWVQYLLGHKDRSLQELEDRARL